MANEDVFKAQQNEIAAFMSGKGEMDYQDLVDQLNANGMAAHVAQLPVMRRLGKTVQRVQNTPSGRKFTIKLA